MAQTKPIRPYIVICEPDLSKLENSVGELMRKGYRPHGSMVIQIEHNEEYYYQPMLLARTAPAKPANKA